MKYRLVKINKIFCPPHKGKMKGCIDTKSAVRTCAFSYSGKMVAFSTDKQMGHPCIINVVDTRTFHADKPVMTIPIPPKGPKVT